MHRSIALAALLLLSTAGNLTAQTGPFPATVALTDGDQIFRAACAACHGDDGRGRAQSVVGFSTPLPDFTVCSFTTPEPDADWLAIVHEGGPVRAFDRKMPAFGGALSEEQILAAIGYVRSLCHDRRWPRGELNLPRPLVTEKAFPENEAVLTTTIGTGESTGVVNQFLYEQRLGARSQFEVAVPLAAQPGASSGWNGGIGDISVAAKHVLAHSLARGSILSVAGEVLFPTGSEQRGLGGGTTVFEPFVALGQILPRDGFLHVQTGVEIPANRDANDEAFWRVAIGKSYMEDRFGRAWSPMIELTAVHEIGAGEGTQWDVVPQLQVTLSRRQHIMINGGVRVPVNDRSARGLEVIAYFLWDWFDGGLLDGWR
ncbi:MAG TPA: c-type cytochrome [Vicinamibacterales bacterium]|nr:c-type cytochrome [Vicinamibacterales bacterium]